MKKRKKIKQKKDWRQRGRKKISANIENKSNIT